MLNSYTENWKMSTNNWLDLETLGSQVMMSKNLPPPQDWFTSKHSKSNPLHVDVFFVVFVHYFEVCSSNSSKMTDGFLRFSNLNWYSLKNQLDHLQLHETIPLLCDTIIFLEPILLLIMQINVGHLNFQSTLDL